ncbi:MAG: homoserine O-succinyltransferase, partial [Gammaproteobacteria bacterium]|nr:homoserine O-succinyltransferase [Gammaproteobacteria bacterium]
SEKIWGVFSHQVVDNTHPLVVDINTRFDVPHSRWNAVTSSQFKQAGLKILAEMDNGGVHLATSPDGFRTVFFQGHPEYDTISLLKEYKREVVLYAKGQRHDYPPFPENYFGIFEQAILNEYRVVLDEAMNQEKPLPELPEDLIVSRLNNTWRDTAGEVIGNWMGLIYQITNSDRRLQFMDGIDPENPLGINL